MANSASFQVQGLEKLLKKMEAPAMTQPVQKYVFIDLTRSGATLLTNLLNPRFPKTAGSVRANWTEDSGKITAQRHPYVFFERGSQYPTTGRYAASGATPRSHRIRRGIKNSALRIRPRRFLGKVRSQVRRDLRGALDKAGKAIEQGWAA